ncbi:spore coat protein SP96-like [Pomacea canaliculata]|uniref:spore coat protein SP96-like n=1 Tax=Pomacea canaliculata TaxID=400727 RepID=UPI000D734979|nr:spore coat protein SP96-like [Pomacea canaliculata]
MDDEGEKRKDVKREALSPRDHELPPEGASRKVEVKEADSASAEEEMSTELRVMSTASSLPGTTCAASKASSSLTSTSVSSASAGSILHVQVPGANGEAGSTTSPQLSTKSVASSSTDSGLCSPDSLHSSGSPETSVNAAGAANSASFVPAGGNSPKDASLGTFQQPRKRGNSASTLVHNRGISPSPGATVQHIFHGQGHGRRVAPLPPAVVSPFETPSSSLQTQCGISYGDTTAHDTHHECSAHSLADTFQADSVHVDDIRVGTTRVQPATTSAAASAACIFTPESLLSSATTAATAATVTPSS